MKHSVKNKSQTQSHRQKPKARTGSKPSPTQLEDELIIASILAGGQERPLKAQSCYGLGYSGSADREPEGPVCAVSAGILFKGVETHADPLTAFHELYGVSHEVASGVSAGFETGADGIDGWCAPPHVVADRARGWAIGAAVRSAIEEKP